MVHALIHPSFTSCIFLTSLCLSHGILLRCQYSPVEAAQGFRSGESQMFKLQEEKKGGVEFGHKRVALI